MELLKVRASENVGGTATVERVRCNKFKCRVPKHPPVLEREPVAGGR